MIRVIARLGDYSATRRRLSAGLRRQLCAQFCLDQCAFQPTFHSLSADSILALEHRAAELDPRYRVGHLLSYSSIGVPNQRMANEVVSFLRGCPELHGAYVDASAVPAAIDERSPCRPQGYLERAPVGIDAAYAWPFAGGKGEGARLVQIEAGLPLPHRALSGVQVRRLYASRPRAHSSHGTAVLGLICGRDTTARYRGIAPGVTDVAIASSFGAGCANALLAALPRLASGDILLIQTQVLSRDGRALPVEAQDAEHDVIRLATTLGGIVIEPGGNGDGYSRGVNLDTYHNDRKERVLHRHPSNAAFRDSGAIMVAAATPAAPHPRMAWSPHGRRVDCYAWGAQTRVCAPRRQDTTRYRGDFGGTSAAAAIVAGAALIVQGIARTRLGRSLGPAEMRSLLSDPLLNTGSASHEPTRIGVMPNLRAIIDTSLLPPT